MRGRVQTLSPCFLCYTQIWSTTGTANTMNLPTRALVLYYILVLCASFQLNFSLRLRGHSRTAGSMLHAVSLLLVGITTLG
jgi:hypothetical protein